MPNEKLREENQQRVMEAAVALCAEKGLEQMSLAELAKEARVSIRSVYRYYECKDALVKKIVEDALARLKESMATTLAQKSYQEKDGANKVIALCHTMLRYAKDNCKLQSKLLSAEPYLNEIGIPDAFSLFDTADNVVTRQFMSAFRDGLKDGSIRPEIVENERNFRVLAVIYRGFYGRIAMISADKAMSEHYDPDQLIEDYLSQLCRILS